jgi:hypothetical protein
MFGQEFCFIKDHIGEVFYIGDNILEEEAMNSSACMSLGYLCPILRPTGRRLPYPPYSTRLLPKSYLVQCRQGWTNGRVSRQLPGLQPIRGAITSLE